MAFYLILWKLYWILTKLALLPVQFVMWRVMLCRLRELLPKEKNRQKCRSKVAMLTLICFMSWLLIYAQVQTWNCTLCKEQNDCSVYILKRTVQYRLLRKLKTLGAFQGCEHVMWKTQGCLNVVETNVNKVERKIWEEVYKKKLVRLKTRKFSTTQSWLRLFVLNGAVCPSVSKLSSLSILCLTKKHCNVRLFKCHYFWMNWCLLGFEK